MEVGLNVTFSGLVYPTPTRPQLFVRRAATSMYLARPDTSQIASIISLSYLLLSSSSISRGKHHATCAERAVLDANFGQCRLSSDMFFDIIVSFET
jgi:hypothetical protein